MAISYMNDFITPCPEVTFLNCLNMWWPGLGVFISALYGKDQIAFYSLGLGAAMMLLTFLADVTGGFCAYIGSWGWALSWTIILFFLVLFYVVTFCCWLFRIILTWYGWIHCFFCYRKYTAMIKEGISM